MSLLSAQKGHQHDTESSSGGQKKNPRWFNESCFHPS